MVKVRRVFRAVFLNIPFIILEPHAGQAAHEIPRFPYFTLDKISSVWYRRLQCRKVLGPALSTLDMEWVRGGG